MRTLNGRFSTPDQVVAQKIKPYIIMLMFLSFTWGMSVSPRVYRVMAREGANNAKLDETNTTPSPTPTPTPIWVPAYTEKEIIIKKIVEVFGEEAPNAFNVLYCENRNLNPKATNHNRNGSIDRGLFQINSIHGGEELFDVDKNIRMAKKIFDNRGWTAWACAERVGIKPFYK